jgi:hypothetical protein
MIIKRQKKVPTAPEIAAANLAKEGVKVRQQIAVVKRAEREMEQARLQSLHTSKQTLKQKAQSWLDEARENVAAQKMSERQMLEQIFV